MNACLPIGAPSTATPIAPPGWRLALSTPEAIPARHAGAASVLQLGSEEVAQAIESLAALSPNAAVRSLRSAKPSGCGALRAHLFDHFAGVLGTELRLRCASAS